MNIGVDCQATRMVRHRAMIAIKEIIEETAAAFDVNPLHLVWLDRHAHLTEARNAVFYIAKKTGHTQKVISDHMSRRDRGSINSGADRCVDLMAGNPAYRERVHRVLENFLGWTVE